MKKLQQKKLAQYVYLLILLLTSSSASSSDLREIWNTNIFEQFTASENTTDLLTKYSKIEGTPNQYWQLTDSEWKRYLELKANSPWSIWENNASPLAILFYYSTSMEDKRKYARIEAELDTWRQHNVAEFQTLYDRERAIVHAMYVESVKRTQPTLSNIRPQDKLRLFIEGGPCDARCRSVVNKVMLTQAKIDIYVVGAPDNDTVFSWAKSASIPVARVKTKEITLNHESGLLDAVAAQLKISKPSLPALFKQATSGDLMEVAI